MEKDVVTRKQITLTSKQRVEHPFAGQNKQHKSAVDTALCFNALCSSKVLQSTSKIIEIEKIYSQIIWVIEVCDQNGDRVSKNNKS